MIFSIHAIIYAMEPFLNPGDLDPCLDNVIEVSFYGGFY